MKNQPIVIGEVSSVLRLGPAGMKNRGDWQQSDSDLFAHFIQVNNQISQSRWSKAKCRFKRQGGRLIESSFPDIEEFVYAAVYFRQLFSRSRSDQLFQSVCERYQRFVQCSGKGIWVAHEWSAFDETLKNSDFMVPDYSRERLIEAFMYGASIFHGISSKQCHKRRDFRNIVANYDKEVVLYALHSSLKELRNHVTRVAAVLYQDFASWIKEFGLPLPDVLLHKNLFECPPQD